MNYYYNDQSVNTAITSLVWPIVLRLWLSESKFNDLTAKGVRILTHILSLFRYNNTQLTTAKNAYRTYFSSILRTDKLGSASEVCMSFISMKQTEKTSRIIHSVSI